MKVKTIFLHMDHQGEPQARATLIVPGLGEVQIQHAISDTLMERLVAEAITALKTKLGQTLMCSPEQQGDIDGGA